MKGLLLILAAAVSLAIGKTAHEFHLSKSEINYDSTSATLQISMHIFIDDLEIALGLNGADNLKIGTGKEAQDADEHIAAYIGKSFSIVSSSDSLDMFFLGKELSADLAAIWCYIEVPLAIIPSELTVDNKLLMEVYADQKNVVTIKKDKKRKADWLFEIDDHTETISF